MQFPFRLNDTNLKRNCFGRWKCINDGNHLFGLESWSFIVTVINVKWRKSSIKLLRHHKFQSLRWRSSLLATMGNFTRQAERLMSSALTQIDENASMTIHLADRKLLHQFCERQNDTMPYSTTTFTIFPQLIQTVFDFDTYRIQSLVLVHKYYFHPIFIHAFVVCGVRVHLAPDIVSLMIGSSGGNSSYIWCWADAGSYCCWVNPPLDQHLLSSWRPWEGCASIDAATDYT